MKETLVKVVALLGLVAILGLAACDPGVTTTTSSSSTTTASSSSVALSTTYVTITVALLPAASNVMDTINGYTNDVYLVGGFGTNGDWKVSNNNVVVADWNAGSTNAKLVAAGTTNGVPMMKIDLVYTGTNNTSPSFKLVNGTPGVGGDWANVEKSGSGGEINGRTFDVVVKSNMAVYYVDTNIINGNDVSVSNTGVQTWAGINPTYQCSNIVITLICTNTTASPDGDTAGNYCFTGSSAWLHNDTNSTWDSSTNGWVTVSGGVTNKADNHKTVTLASPVISLTFTHNGSAAIAFKLLAKKTGNWQWGDVQKSMGVAFTSKTGTNITNIWVETKSW